MPVKNKLNGLKIHLMFTLLFAAGKRPPGNWNGVEARVRPLQCNRDSSTVARALDSDPDISVANGHPMQYPNLPCWWPVANANAPSRSRAPAPERPVFQRPSKLSTSIPVHIFRKEFADTRVHTPNKYLCHPVSDGCSLGVQQRWWHWLLLWQINQTRPTAMVQRSEL